MQPKTEQTTFSRYLRRNQTDAEEALWARLRNRQLEGARFRRQHPIGPYIVDFVNLAAKLVIELDGGQHNVSPTAERDAERTAWLNSEGYRVLRFWNNDVLSNIDGVLEVIRSALR